VEAEAAGFTRKVVKDVHLEVGKLVHCEIQLDVGTVSTTVEVEADLSPLRPEQAQQADIINEVQVETFQTQAGIFFHDRTTDAGDYFDKLAGPGIKLFEQS
jgi:hypothetical protein